MIGLSREAIWSGLLSLTFLYVIHSSNDFFDLWVHHVLLLLNMLILFHFREELMSIKSILIQDVFLINMVVLGLIYKVLDQIVIIFVWLEIDIELKVLLSSFRTLGTSWDKLNLLFVNHLVLIWGDTSSFLGSFCSSNKVNLVCLFIRLSFVDRPLSLRFFFGDLYPTAQMSSPFMSDLIEILEFMRITIYVSRELPNIHSLLK